MQIVPVIMTIDNIGGELGGPGRHICIVSGHGTGRRRPRGQAMQRRGSGEERSINADT